MRQATGPWADYFHGLAAEPHDWDKLLAQSRQLKPLDDAARANIATWEKEHKAKLSENNPPIRPHAPYAAYAERVAEDWRTDLQALMDRSQAGGEARKEAGKIYEEYRRWLLGFLEENSEAIAAYQHELWRLEELKSSPAADDVPFQKQRIAEKAAETNAAVRPWVARVAALETAFHSDAARALSGDGQPVALPGPTDRLSTIDRVVPYWHVIVGGALVLGLFSRLAGAGAAVFLIMVLATQPPWVTGAADTYYQMVELAGALVLATIPTGRFAGLDFFLHSLTARCCSRT